MVEFEADDALPAGADLAARDEGGAGDYLHTRIRTWRAVRGGRLDCAVEPADTRVVCDEGPGVIAKFGVRPESIPDYLALVGDAADGYPGAAGMG